MFNSIEYYMFLVLVIVFFYALPKRFSKITLLLASYVLYLYWEPAFFWVLLIETFVVYQAALICVQGKRSYLDKYGIYLVVVLSFCVLFYFKYRPTLLLGETNASGYYNLLRPLGISFFTFQGVAYLVDVKRGRRPSTNIIDVALYLSFFPQLVAGPIERAKKLIPQFSKPSEQIYQNFSKGIFYIALGLFLKVFVADNLELYVQKSLYSEQSYSNIIILLGIAFFFIQLYADFSAYTLIAIGSASFFGIRLSENFRQPFSSVSPSDFWRRWHMTLMLWLRDYIYVPIARRKFLNKVFARGLATFSVFMFFSIWHGVSTNFLLFGLLNFVLAFYDAQVLAKWKDSLIKKALRYLCLLLGYLSILFLAAENTEHAKELMFSMFSFASNENFLPTGVGVYQFGICIAACIVLFFLDFIQEKNNQTLYQYTRSMSFAKKLTVYLIFMNVFFVFGEFGHKEFAYFGF